MNKKLSTLEAPALAGVVKARTPLSAIAEIKNCLYGGAAMIDLHLSCLEKTDTDTLKTIIGASKLPVLALNYNTTMEWTDAGYTEDARVECFLRAVEAGAAGIDMQGYTFDIASKDSFIGEDKYSFTKNSPKEVVTDTKVIDKQCELIERVHAKGAEVLLSCHPGIAMSADAVVELALFLEKRTPDIIKIVTIANNDDEMLESVRAMLTLKKELKTPVSYHAAGKAGVLTRILNPVLGGQIAFCNAGYHEGSTMEQPDLRTVRAIVDNMKKLI